jgi:hypothetical protein
MPGIEIGIVCAGCDTYSVIGAQTCAVCANDLALFRPAPTPVAPAAQAGAASSRRMSEPSLFDDPLRPRKRPTPGGQKAVTGAHDVRNPAAPLSQE